MLSQNKNQGLYGGPQGTTRSGLYHLSVLILSHSPPCSLYSSHTVLSAVPCLCQVCTCVMALAMAVLSAGNALPLRIPMVPSIMSFISLTLTSSERLSLTTLINLCLSYSTLTCLSPVIYKPQKGRDCFSLSCSLLHA